MKPLTLQERLKLAATPIAQPQFLPAPGKGWNTRDNLTSMDPQDAVLLDNFFPDTAGVNVRNGYVSYATGVGTNPVRTLAEYSAGGTRKFLAASSGNIYDISASGAAGAPLAGSFSNDEWQTALFLSRLFFANGQDTMQVYNGTTIGNSTFTGVTLSTLIGVCIYQQRLFTWARNSTGFWFAPLNSITGALSFFDLAAFSPHGGDLVTVTTFSHDGGNGVLDFIAFIMSSGDCLIYYGNDPSTLLNFQLIGIYRISPPVNIRAVCNYGAEAFLTTFDDHVPLEAQLTALQEGKLPPRSKVSAAVRDAVAANASGFGWQALYYPKGRRLIFNIPNPDGTFNQHVQNTGITYIDQITGQKVSPWCRFVDMNSYCWGLFNNNLYFGATGGVVYQADTGNLDNLGVVTAEAQQAWNTFESPMRKRVTAVRPIFQSIGTIGLTFSVGFDYGPTNVSTTLQLANTGSPWDTSPWDTSPWSSEQTVSTLWHASGGSGTAVSVAVASSSNQPAVWLRSDLRGEIGQAL